MTNLGDIHYHTIPNVSRFFRKRFNQRRLQFLFAHSFSNLLAVSCFSFWKAFVKCPSLSVNGIFDDVRHDVVHHDVVSTQQCWSVGLIFFNVLIRWSIRMICSKNYEIVFKFVKVMPRKLVASFFPDMVYNKERSAIKTVITIIMQYIIKNKYTTGVKIELTDIYWGRNLQMIQSFFVHEGERGSSVLER